MDPTTSSTLTAGDLAAAELAAPRLPTSGQIHMQISQAAQLLPPPDLAPVAPALREQFAALPAEQRAGIDWTRQAPEQLFADLPPDQTLAVMVDVAGLRMVELSRAFAGRVEGLERNADLYTEGGLYHEQRALRAAHVAELDQVAGAVASQLARMDDAAMTTIARHRAAGYAIDPSVELVARQRWQDAAAAGPEAVAALFDGVVGAGDVAAAHALVRIAETAIAGTGVTEPEAWSRAQALRPMVERLAASLKGPDVLRAEALRAAIPDARQRLLFLRSALEA